MQAPVLRILTVSVIHELPFKGNAALGTDKETGIREDHKVGNHLEDAELSKRLKELQRHRYLLRISVGLHPSLEADISVPIGTPKRMLNRETRSAEELEFSPHSRALT